MIERGTHRAPCVGMAPPCAERERRARLVCALFTLACIPLTWGCEPTEGSVTCVRSRDCPAAFPSCFCDGRCHSAIGGAVDGGTAAGPTTQAFVLFPLLWDTPSADQAHGLNLDARVDGPANQCTGELDYVSPTTGEPGVDDDLALVTPTLESLLPDGWEGGFRDATEAGEAAVALEITEDGASRVVHAWLVAFADAPQFPRADDVCSAITAQSSCVPPCAWTARAGACSGIAPGQSWRRLSDLGAVSATRIGRRLSTSTRLRSVTLTPTVTGGPQPFALHEVGLEADLCGDRLERGELGGALSVTDAQAWVDAVFHPSIDVHTVLLPDLTPSADGLTCADISVGVGFAGVPSVLVP